MDKFILKSDQPFLKKCSRVYSFILTSIISIGFTKLSKLFEIILRTDRQPDGPANRQSKLPLKATSCPL